MSSQTSKLLLLIERGCHVLGVLGLCLVGSVYADSWLQSTNAVAEIKSAALANELDRNHRSSIDGAGALLAAGSKASTPLSDNSPRALLSIGRLDVEVPVFLGTDARTLNRGAGIVAGTALPGEPGNMVISAHRDSFFRPLEQLEIGDRIELQTPEGLQHYRVETIFITDPLDVSVLEPLDKTVLTLITCYPFRYIGFAPDRYVVRATKLVNEAST